MVDSELDKCQVSELADSLLPRLHAAVVPIYLIPNDAPRKPSQCGTGTLFRVADMHFLISAEHVMSTARSHSGALYTYDLAQGSSFVPLNGEYYADGENDVAVFPLDTSQIRALPGRTFLRIHDADCTLRQPDDGWYLIHGYPHCWTLVEIDTKSATCKPYTRVSRLYGGSTTSFERFDERIHLLMDHNHAKSFAPSKLKQDSPDRIHGVSGCSVWRVIRDGDAKDLWNPDKARIIAIETGIYKKGRVVKGTRWAFVYHILYSCFPELRAPLELVIPETAPPNGNLEGLTPFKL